MRLETGPLALCALLWLTSNNVYLLCAFYFACSTLYVLPWSTFRNSQSNGEPSAHFRIPDLKQLIVLIVVVQFCGVEREAN